MMEEHMFVSCGDGSYPRYPAFNVDRPMYPVKTRVEPRKEKRRKEIVDQKGVEEEVARNVSKILSASRVCGAENPLPKPVVPRQNLPCSQCSRTFSSIRNLQRHRGSCGFSSTDTMLESPEALPARMEDVPSAFSCPDCQRVLCSASNLRRHRVTCRGAAEQLTPKPSNYMYEMEVSNGETEEMKETPTMAIGDVSTDNSDEDDKKALDGRGAAIPPARKQNTLRFQCTVCEKTFSCRKNVRRHVLAIHKSTALSFVKLEDDEKEKKPSAEPESVPPPVASPVTEESSSSFSSSVFTASSTSSFRPLDPLLAFSPLDTWSDDGDSLVDEPRVPRFVPSKKKRGDEDDVFITARSAHFVVSRSGLSRASSYFGALFSLNEGQNEIELDADPLHLQILLDVHNNISSINPNNIGILFDMANRLKFATVRQACEKYLVDTLPRYSVMRAIRLADKYELSDAKETLFDSITVDVFRSISTNQDYQMMNSELKSELLEKWGSFL